MKTITKADARPSKRLGKEPTVKTLDDVDVALHELAWLNSRKSTVDASAEQRIRLIKDEAEKELVVEGGVKFADRQAALTAAIEAYALAHRDQFVSEKSKSRTFMHGIVAFKDRPARVQFNEGEDKKSVLAKLTDGLAVKIEAWLKRMGLRPFVKLSIDLDIAAIGRDAKDQKLTAEQLADVGLSYGAGEDVIVDPAEHLPE